MNIAKNRLVTASMMDAIDWLHNCPSSWKEKARKSLRDQLARDYTEPMGEALKLGIKFEDAVYTQARLASVRKALGSEHFEWFVAECTGGLFQKVDKIYAEIDGTEYCLYCKYDVWFPGQIKDIKTTSNWKGPWHYLERFQHKLYAHVSGINQFRYLVAEFEPKLEGSDKQPSVAAHHAVDWTCTDRTALADEVLEGVRDAVNFLKKDDELFDLYINKFSRGR